MSNDNLFFNFAEQRKLAEEDKQPIIKEDEEDIIFSVSELTESIKHTLSSNYGNVQVLGEVSSLSRPTSGHIYFDLKDADALIKCVYFRSYHTAIKHQLAEGALVRIVGDVSVYERTGVYQIVVQEVAFKGVGNFQIAYQELKRQLKAEGLFAAEHKKPIPPYAMIVGVVTSPTGAAIRDILQTTKIHFANVQIIIYPTMVQGDNSPQEIADAILRANNHGHCEVLIVGRGGGSADDLFAFNTEVVARAIFDSNIPIISAVGHEDDISIADWVADLRVATPTAAAEYVSQYKKELIEVIVSVKARLVAHVHQLLKLCKSQVERFAPERLKPLFINRYHYNIQLLDTLDEKIKLSMKKHLEDKSNRLRSAKSMLTTLSPKKVMERGYAVVKHQQKIITNATNLKAGDEVNIQFYDSSVKAKTL